ncbi:type II transport GspH family protein [Collimonas arenae]|uniref:Type II transport GspH family protein n=1 Tax=Collimonas arenae TaxID=279058 RepID=A0A127QND8_9BURK|nr:type II transport GspH family protein [Collimonas arenae]AMP11305.1 type II transport GspH family protein [Collimonas arenae]
MTLTVMTILLLMVVPSFVGWMNNSKVRSVAEGLQNGLRAAQAEAIRRSHQTAFVLTGAAPKVDTPASTTGSGSNWYIEVLPVYTGETVDTPFVEGGSFSNLAPGVNITATPAAASLVCFNSMGRLVANNDATTTKNFGTTCTAPTGNITYDVTLTGATHPLRVLVGLGGQVRMCDTTRTLSPTVPDGCP